MLTDTLETEYLARIRNALKTAHDVVKRFAPGTFAVKDNGERDVITQVDRAVSHVLHAALLKGTKAGSPKRMWTTLAASRNNGLHVQPTPRTNLNGAVVLASRQEYKRGEWAQFEGKQFSIRSTGSVAYKLALVSAGLAHATWTLSPKHEWDVAAGVALVNSGGGTVACIRDGKLQFNQSKTLLPGLVASGGGIWQSVSRIVDEALVS